MPEKFILSAALMTTLLLGCDSDQYAEASTTSTTSVSINAMPIIMNVIAGKIPEINRGNRENVLNQVCRVAYGEIKPAALRGEINQAGLIQKNNEKADAFTQLMQDEDVVPYQVACAAYMIGSIEAIPDVNQYVSQKKDANGQPAMEANEEAVINLMPFRVAVARATTELYGKIAADLPEKKAQSMEMYNQKIHRLFSQSAASFLTTVRKYNQEEMSHHYQLLLLQKGKFIFKSSTGYLMDVSPEGVNLSLYGAPWMGSGYIMGVRHSIDITLN